MLRQQLKIAIEEDSRTLTVVFRSSRNPANSVDTFLHLNKKRQSNIFMNRGRNDEAKVSARLCSNSAAGGYEPFGAELWRGAACPIGRTCSTPESIHSKSCIRSRASASATKGAAAFQEKVSGHYWRISAGWRCHRRPGRQKEGCSNRRPGGRGRRLCL